MWPKGKRDRRGVLLSLLQCLRQTPGSPCTPWAWPMDFLGRIFIACAGALFNLLKRGGSYASSSAAWLNQQFQSSGTLGCHQAPLVTGACGLSALEFHDRAAADFG